MTDVSSQPLLAASMSPLDWVWFGLLVLALIGALYNLPRLWRYEFKHHDRVPAYWPWGEALWHGYVRMMPFSIPAVLVYLVCLLVGLRVPEEPTGPFARPLWYVVPALVSIGLVMLVMFTIIFFNWPKRLVAPHLRRQPGALAFWLRAWRRKRAGSRPET